MEKCNSKIYDRALICGETTTNDEANVYGPPRLIQECPLESKYHYINDKKICFERYWTIFCEERWRVYIDNKTLYEDLISEPNIKDLNLTKKSMENLTERDFRDNSISCPNCDNHDLVFLGNGQYRCNSCGELFDIDDCETI